MGRWRQRLAGGIGAVAATAALLALPAAASADEIDDYQGSWIDRALSDQYQLGSDVPLRNAPFLGTHNSFNSTAEMGPTLSAQDSNQRIDIVSQLRIDVRSLELDLHRFPSAGEGGFAPVVCHAFDGGVGCTVEKPLGPVLEEIAGWLREPANSEQVILLYLEDHLQDEATHEKAAATIEAKIGDLVYRPPSGGGCTELPYGLTRSEVRQAGKQVLLVSGCGIGSGWRGLVHSWSEHRESRPFGYEDFPSCGPDFTRAEYDSTLIRYFEDSTQLTARFGRPDDGITPETAAAMARCGVDLLGLDQLTPFDGRLEASVWSWEVGEPDGEGDCASIVLDAARPYGRWSDRDCAAARLPAACRDATGAWLLSKKRSDGDRAGRSCDKEGAELAVPRTGYENQLVRSEMERRGVDEAWLGYRLAGGGWQPLDSR